MTDFKTIAHGYQTPTDWIREPGISREQSQIRQGIFDTARWRALSQVARNYPARVRHAFQQRMEELRGDGNTEKLTRLREELKLLEPCLRAGKSVSTAARADPRSIWGLVQSIAFRILQNVGKSRLPEGQQGIRPGKTDYRVDDVWDPDDTYCTVELPGNLQQELRETRMLPARRAVAGYLHVGGPADFRAGDKVVFAGRPATVVRAHEDTLELRTYDNHLVHAGKDEVIRWESLFGGDDPNPIPLRAELRAADHRHSYSHEQNDIVSGPAGSQPRLQPISVTLSDGTPGWVIPDLTGEEFDALASADFIAPDEVHLGQDVWFDQQDALAAAEFVAARRNIPARQHHRPHDELSRQQHALHRLSDLRRSRPYRPPTRDDVGGNQSFEREEVPVRDYLSDIGNDNPDAATAIRWALRQLNTNAGSAVVEPNSQFRPSANHYRITSRPLGNYAIYVYAKKTGGPAWAVISDPNTGWQIVLRRFDTVVSGPRDTTLHVGGPSDFRSGDKVVYAARPATVKRVHEDTLELLTYDNYPVRVRKNEVISHDELMSTSVRWPRQRGYPHDFIWTVVVDPTSSSTKMTDYFFQATLGELANMIRAGLDPVRQNATLFTNWYDARSEAERRFDELMDMGTISPPSDGYPPDYRWTVVVDPTPSREMVDILFRATLGELANMIRGGLDPVRENAVLFTNWHDARAEAERRFAGRQTTGGRHTLGGLATPINLLQFIRLSKELQSLGWAVLEQLEKLIRQGTDIPGLNPNALRMMLPVLRSLQRAGVAEAGDTHDDIKSYLENPDAYEKDDEDDNDTPPTRW